MFFLNKNNLNYGINLSRYDLLLKKFGIKNKKFKNLNNNIKFLEKDLDTFLKINLIKKDYLIKVNIMNKLKKIESGSYKGYKLYRGLPVNNQRTKTNSRTARKKY